MKKILSILLAIVMAVSLCACGSTMNAEYTKAAATEEYIPEPEMAYDMAAAAGGFSNGTYSLAESPAEGAAGEGTDAPSENPEKLIYSADVTIETTDFDESIDKLTSMLAEQGAYVQSSAMNSATYYGISSGNPGTRSAYYTIRVPADKFSTLMSSLTNLGNVPYSNTYTENVTSQYYDVQARLNNYQAQEKRLNELLEKANTVSDIIEIENKLTEVRYQIESLQSTLKNWDRKVSMSTINLSIDEVGEYTPVAKETFGSRLARAFRNGFDGFKEVLLVIAELLPTLVFLGIVAVGIIHVVLRVKRNRKSKKEKTEATEEDSKEQ